MVADYFFSSLSKLEFIELLLCGSYWARHRDTMVRNTGVVPACRMFIIWHPRKCQLFSWPCGFLFVLWNADTEELIGLFWEALHWIEKAKTTLRLYKKAFPFWTEHSPVALYSHLPHKATAHPKLPSAAYDLLIHSIAHAKKLRVFWFLSILSSIPHHV